MRFILIAMALTGLIVGIPLFYSVGFVIMVPLIFSVATRTQLPVVYLGIPLVVRPVRGAWISAAASFADRAGEAVRRGPGTDVDLWNDRRWRDGDDRRTVAGADAEGYRGPSGVAQASTPFLLSAGPMSLVTPSMRKSLPGPFNSCFTALLPVLLIAATTTVAYVPHASPELEDASLPSSGNRPSP